MVLHHSPAFSANIYVAESGPFSSLKEDFVGKNVEPILWGTPPRIIAEPVRRRSTIVGALNGFAFQASQIAASSRDRSLFTRDSHSAMS
jgi:hypothetical protein